MRCCCFCCLVLVLVVYFVVGFFFYVWVLFLFCFFFFFSSRRRHTRSYGDWSSDVCSSDLRVEVDGRQVRLGAFDHAERTVAPVMDRPPQSVDGAVVAVRVEVVAPEALRAEGRRDAGQQRERGASGSQRAARTGTPCP